MTTPTCHDCKHWAPFLRERNFLGRCIAPERPMDRCTDRVDTCNLWEDKPAGNTVAGEKIKGFLE